MSIPQGQFDLTFGLRNGCHVIGLGTAYGMIHFDYLPADVRYIPANVFYKFYIPVSNRFALYCGIDGGPRFYYKYLALSVDESIPQPGTVKWYGRLSGGISLRLWGKSNIFIGPTTTLGSRDYGLFGIQAGVAI